MQKNGLQFQKLAEICTFLENWSIAGLRHKKRDISTNFVNWGPICMRGQLYMCLKKGEYMNSEVDNKKMYLKWVKS